ncbi:DUF4476 domain-containing protein [Pontibacter silvestris]|uniref:DUF4476 domain-containing protein n=1 Tax=Pontibacter silvestris TaxID=2305183 RepID=A0ABW4WXY0_9BACT|nr:DUF4476 domain-containing protein [Pontibacter silvestris]MCC9136642.1 DUF4476 domain-containing protein [Pontibacter silvestris]
MKKFLFPLLLVLLVLPVWAQASVLTFATPKGEPFQIRLNGKMVNYTASNFVRVTNLKPGKHYVEFKVMSRRGVYRMAANVLVPIGVEANYAVRTANRGRVYLRLINEVPLVPPPVTARPQPIVPRYPDNHNNRNEPAPPVQDSEEDACRNLMDKYDIDKLIESVDGREFESTKLTIACEAVRSGSILAEDLKRLLEQFSYESSKVELAKFAYNYVCDKEHFYYVYDAFENDISIRELGDYVNRR